MSNLKDLKGKLDTALDAYRAKADELTSSAAREMYVEIEALQKEISATITDGAKPCPCGAGTPHGIEHPKPKGAREYEVGCLVCTNRVRGGLIPRHAVEAWNQLVDEKTAEKPS